MSNLKKRERVLKVLTDIRASYWFIPTVLICFGLMLAGATEWADRAFDARKIWGFDALVGLSPDAARGLLAVLAQSVIGVTGVMFSMTLVAVSFASGNFGPRLIGNFMRDRGNQWSLGILISTFVYIIAILRAVDGGDGAGAPDFVPHISLMIVLCLALLCVFTIVFFIHHVPEMINVGRISAALSHRIEKQIGAMIDAQGDEQEDAGKEVGTWPEEAAFVLRPETSGYVQTIEMDDLKRLAEAHDWYVVVAVRIGDFVTSKTDVVTVFARQSIAEEQCAEIRACCVIGINRTEQQNPTFIAQQLVEMVARALSPGVNDPYTAMDCLNRLASALTVASTYKEGLIAQRGERRLRMPPLGFDHLFENTFPLCRQYIEPDKLVTAHTIELLTNLAEAVEDRDRAVVLEELSGLKGQGQGAGGDF